MNISIIFLTIVIFFIEKTFTAPYYDYGMYESTGGTEDFAWMETTEASTTVITTTTTTTTTTAITTTTTTTTTLAPEVDREWEDLILAGPTVVNYLSLFMVLASRTDLPLTVTNGYTLKYIQNVNSLRAILSQVSTAIQEAFKMARGDLARTQASMDQIPDHIKAGLLLIQTAPVDLLKKLLPYTLRNVDRAADEGAIVTKPTLQSFISVGALIEELATVLDSTSSDENADYLIEAKAYANDIKTQWDLLVKLFQKFSDRADLTKQVISSSFTDPIQQSQLSNTPLTAQERKTQIQQLISMSVAIDQSSHLLDMMVGTYTEISNDHMIDDIGASKSYLALQVESKRSSSSRQLWQKIITQSVKVARLAQNRQNQFAEASPNRNDEYHAYLEGVAA